MMPCWSWLFRKLLDLRGYLRDFFYIRLGSGLETNAWEDKWLICGALATIISYRRFNACGFNLTSTAREVIDECNGEWPESWVNLESDLINQPFPTLLHGVRDCLRWITPRRQMVDFSVKDVWKSLYGDFPSANWSKYVWFKGCIPKHSFCLWVACHMRLPTQDRVGLWKHDPPDMMCPLCNQCPDSHNHLFFGCKFSLEVWRAIKRDVELYGYVETWDDIVQSLNDDRGPSSTLQKLALGATVYVLWRERNKRIFQNRQKVTVQIVKDIRDVVLMRMAWMNRKRASVVSDDS